MTTLALDLGQSLGWVKGNITGPMTYGTFPMPVTTDLGRWVHASDDFFRQVLPGVTSIAVEQPFLGQSYWPARKLISLLGHVHYQARLYGIGSAQINEVPIATGKLNLAGSGAADAEMMIAAALERYGLELDEHSAHALGIWDVHIFGRRKAIAKPRTRSSKGVIVGAADA